MVKRLLLGSLFLIPLALMFGWAYVFEIAAIFESPRPWYGLPLFMTAGATMLASLVLAVFANLYH